MAKVAGILGKKVGITQLFDSKGEVRPATVLQAGPCVITQHKTAARDGYESAQIGLVEFVKEKRLTKPMQGHFAKNNLPPMKFLREVPIEIEEGAGEGAESNGLKVGQRVLVDIFEGDRFVDVSGVSKGRGFAGVVKRHHFGGGPKTHGQSDRHRAPGSIGSGTTPGRVLQGTRMAGRMGGERVTVKNLRVLQVDPERNLIAVAGAVPGARNGLLIIRKSRGPP